MIGAEEKVALAIELWVIEGFSAIKLLETGGFLATESFWVIKVCNFEIRNFSKGSVQSRISYWVHMFTESEARKATFLTHRRLN